MSTLTTNSFPSPSTFHIPIAVWRPYEFMLFWREGTFWSQFWLTGETVYKVQSSYVAECLWHFSLACVSSARTEMSVLYVSENLTGKA